MTYNFIANSMAAESASLVYHPNRGVVDINTRDEKAPESGVKEAGGAIFTGFYPNWPKLLDREKQSIFDERERLNIKGEGKHKSFDKKNRAGLHPSSSKKAAQKVQHKISYLKAKCKELEEKRSTRKKADEPQENAGYQFCGRKGKNQKKSSDRLIGILLFHWAEVINYLVNCLFITTRRTK